MFFHLSFDIICLGVLLLMGHIRAEPDIAYIFGSPLTENGQTVKNRKRVNSGNQKYR